MDTWGAQKILAHTKNHRKLYVPLFLKAHWIAGIMEYDTSSGFTLHLYDSAPSEQSSRTLEERVRQYWRHVRICHRPCPRQLRYSEDCGIFMLTNFFADYYRLPLPLPQDQAMPKELRTLYDHTVMFPSTNSNFRQQFTDILRRAATKEIPTTHLETIVGGTATTPLLHQVIRRTNQLEAVAANRNLCYMLTATALIILATQKAWSMKLKAFQNRAARLRFRQNTQQDVAETIATMRSKNPFTVVPFGRPSPNTEPIPLAPHDPSRPLFLQTSRDLTLPAHVGTLVFVAGAEYCGDESGKTGHYRLTTARAGAVVGLYLSPDTAARIGCTIHEGTTPGSTTVVDARDPLLPVGEEVHRDDLLPHTAVGKPCASDTSNADPMAEYQRILNSTPLFSLNGPGRQLGGMTCPREWFIYHHRPPHVQAYAWAGMTEGVRNQQRRWVQTLKAMPEELHRMPLEKGILEQVRRMARARGWAVSTFSTTLTTIHGALLNLPLYTNEERGLDPMIFPEWRAASKTMHRLAKAIEANPAPWLTHEHCKEVKKHLKHTDPLTHMYLTLMWVCAARAGDIDGLKKGSVQLGKSPGRGRPVAFAPTIRTGKGTRFRGPYPIPTAVSAEDAVALQRILSGKREDQYLFKGAPVRGKLRQALKKLNPRYALASVRKGGVMYLAKNGLATDQLMQITGHTTVATLQRYLGYSLQLTKEGETTQAAVERVLQKNGA